MISQNSTATTWSDSFQQSTAALDKNSCISTCMPWRRTTYRVVVTVVLITCMQAVSAQESVQQMTPAVPAATAPATEMASVITPETSAASAATTDTDGTLEKLLAPIALYPDNLLAQVLAASTYPLDVAKAAQVVELGGTAQDGPMYGWDASITELMNFPDVLKQMAADITGTTALGEAVVTTPDLVFSTIQDLRTRAQASGALQSNEQQNVVAENDVIAIAPADPTVVYVPQYDPATVYAEPVYAYPNTQVVYPAAYPAYATGAGIAFAAGVAVGDSWYDYNMDWDDGGIYLDEDRLDDINWDDVDWGTDINIERNIGDINIDNARNDFFNNVKGDLTPEQFQKVEDSFNRLDPAKQQDYLKNWSQLPPDRKNEISGNVRRQQKLQPANRPGQQPGGRQGEQPGTAGSQIAGAAAGAGAAAAAARQGTGAKIEWKHDTSRAGAVGTDSNLYQSHSGKAQSLASQPGAAQNLQQAGRTLPTQTAGQTRQQASSAADIQQRLQTDTAQRGAVDLSGRSSAARPGGQQAVNLAGQNAASRPQPQARPSQQQPSVAQRPTTTQRPSSSSYRPPSSSQRQPSSRSAVSGSGSRSQTSQYQNRGSQSRQTASRPASRPSPSRSPSRPPSMPSGGGARGGRR